MNSIATFAKPFSADADDTAVFIDVKFSAPHLLQAVDLEFCVAERKFLDAVHPRTPLKPIVEADLDGLGIKAGVVAIDVADRIVG